MKITRAQATQLSNKERAHATETNNSAADTAHKQRLQTLLCVAKYTILAWPQLLSPRAYHEGTACPNGKRLGTYAAIPERGTSATRSTGKRADWKRTFPHQSYLIWVAILYLSNAVPSQALDHGIVRTTYGFSTSTRFLVRKLFSSANRSVKMQKRNVCNSKSTSSMEYTPAVE